MAKSRPYVLLTGATGMVGAQLLARLMRRHVPVLALVRGKGALSAESRIDAVLAQFEDAWNRRLGRPAILAGDMALPRLGLSRQDEHIIRESCGTVLHCAASMSFRPATDSPDNEPYRTNVDGTATLLELCRSASIDKFHYVSTAYVCGVRSGVANENELDIGQTFANDYERSKVEAEKLLRSSQVLSSLTVYRPSIVIDSGGRSPFAQDRTIYGAFSLFRALTSKFGIPENGQWFRNLGFTGSERKNLVEAQWVADVIDGIFATRQLHDATYHVTDGTGTSVNEIEAAFHQVVSQSESASVNGNGHHSNGKMKNGTASRRSATLVSRSVTPEHSLIDTIAAPYVQTFLPYFKDDPTFDRGQLKRALSELGLPDHSHVGSTTIAKVASVQLAQENPATPRGKNRVESVHAGELGDRLLSKLVIDAVERTSTDRARDNSRDWGIILTGPSGGDWRLDIDAISVVPAGQSCLNRLYCDRVTWNSLICQHCSVSESLVSGHLLIECDESEFNSLDQSLHRAVENLISRLIDYANQDRLGATS
jgi:thioester reductase-like protein